jgi:hypothetical protein
VSQAVCTASFGFGGPFGGLSEPVRIAFGLGVLFILVLVLIGIFWSVRATERKQHQELLETFGWSPIGLAQTRVGMLRGTMYGGSMRGGAGMWRGLYAELYLTPTGKHCQTWAAVVWPQPICALSVPCAAAQPIEYVMLGLGANNFQLSGNPYEAQTYLSPEIQDLMRRFPKRVSSLGFDGQAALLVYSGMDTDPRLLEAALELCANFCQRAAQTAAGLAGRR